MFLLQMINQFFDTFFGLKHVDQLQVDQFKYKFKILKIRNFFLSKTDFLASKLIHVIIPTI